MLNFRDITIAFDGRTILEHFSLEVARGEKAVLRGPSGAGKSSLMALLLGFLAPAAGTVWLDGQEVTRENINNIRQKTAWVPQEASLPVEFVRQLVDTAFGLRANRSAKPDKAALLETFEKLGLGSEIYEKRLGDISGGEKQRVMIAIAALLRKPVLLLDEPTSALDPASTERLASFLHGLKETTILAISHDSRFINSFPHQIQIGG